MDYRQLEKEQYKRVATQYIAKKIEIDKETKQLNKENKNYLCGVLYGLCIADIITFGEFEFHCKTIKEVYEGEKEQ